MRTITIILLLIVLAFASAGDFNACTCACLDQTVERYIGDAKVIVVGRVIEIEEKSIYPDPNNDDIVIVSSCGEQWVRVAITQQLKGEPSVELTFVREDIGTACDFKFPLRVGYSYLLFGFLGDDGKTLYLSGCSPSRPVSKAGKMIKRVKKQLALAS